MYGLTTCPGAVGEGGPGGAGLVSCGRNVNAEEGRSSRNFVATSIHQRESGEMTESTADEPRKRECHESRASTAGGTFLLGEGLT